MGDVPRLHGGLGVLLLRLAFQRHLPGRARKRAAEIRTANQIGGVVADIGALTQKRQIEEAERLFDTDGWKAYDKQLASLAQAAQGAQGEIEKYFVQQMEERRRAIAQQQERIATAQSGQAGLAGKKMSLTEELSRLKAERPGLAAEYGQHKSELDAKAKEIDAKRVEGLAEDRGVEGTLKQGKGPVYRQRMAELGTLQDQYKIKQERTKDAQKRLVARRDAHRPDRARAVHHRRRSGQAEGRGRDRRAAHQDGRGGQRRRRGRQARPRPRAAGLRARARRLPPAARHRAARRPAAAVRATWSTPCRARQATKDKVRAIDCDPKQAAEAAARVFALNAGIVAFQANCAGGDKLAQAARPRTRCSASAASACRTPASISTDSADVGARLSGIDMNRDDKAHRFVVTWNAFLDGNRLAYLALVLAIGVDALVFMSGLFGAQALRSPLSDVPSPKAQQRPSAGGHHRGGAAARHLQERAPGAARHASAAAGGRLHQRGQARRARSRERLAGRDVLNAGATIGAVRETDTPGHYLVRSELHTFLSDVIKRELKRKPEETEKGLDLDRLEKRIREALMPHVLETSDAVLQHLHPIDEVRGFTSEIFLNEVDQQHLRPVRNLLTAGSSLRVVARDKNDTLALLRARRPLHDARPHPGARAGDGRSGRAGPSQGRPAAASGHRRRPRRPRLLTNGNARPYDPAPVPADDELRAQLQETLMRALGLTLGRAAQDRGAGDRRSGSERRGLPSSARPPRITGSTSN